MKIKEVCQQTGLSRKTIRFYEAQELFSPEKTFQNGREFRNYSEEDVRQLLKIATLRRARFSIDEIRRMQDNPEDTTAIFRDYRERLHEETRDLQNILTVADSIAEDELTSADDLITRMEAVSAGLPLPAADVHPRFRYLDDLEELMNMRKKKLQMTEQEKKQHQIAADNAVMYAAFDTRSNTGNNMAAGGHGCGFDITNSQKIAAYNLLMNSKDD